MASVFSLVQCIPQVERGACGQKCGGSKFFVPKIRNHAVIRACSEQKPSALRSTSQEITMSAANFVLPLFIHEGKDDVPVEYMPDCNILGWRHGLLDEVYKARDVGVKCFLLIPKIPNSQASIGDEAFNDNGLIPRTIRLLKDKYPDIVIYTDVPLDPYSFDMYNDIRREKGVIMNDESVHHLCKRAVSLAHAGADVVSPRGVMDGCFGSIRVALDEEGFHDVFVMSYFAKYFFFFYDLPDKSCQIDSADCREAIIEIADFSKGADILLVKPGPPSCNAIHFFRDNFSLPIAAYQVSAVYSSIKGTGGRKMVNEEKMMMESLMCLRRAGADIILTYFARQAATVLAGDRLQCPRYPL